MSLHILRAPAYLAVQDAGRAGHRAEGVPASGAMDAWALAAGNLLAGNPADAAALEWSVSGGAVRFEAGGVFALAGASVEAELDGRPVASWRTLRAPPGGVLAIRRFREGRFLYLAVRGGIAVPVLLGSRATYLPGRFGGLEGRCLAAGDRLPLGEPAGEAPPPGFSMPPRLGPAYERETVRATAGPDAASCAPAALRLLEEHAFRVSSASDRTGYRLEGAPLPVEAGAQLLSAPVCPGVVQLPAGGAPIVLMADGPTVGGYPKVAVVVEADLPVLAQKPPGATVRFRIVSPEEARAAARRRAAEIFTLRHLIGRAREGTA